MIDLHAHILPGLDDGARDVREGLEMLRVAARDGIRTMVATPHVREGVFDNTREGILEALDAFRVEVEKEGIAVELLPGADVHVSADLIEQVGRGEVLTINDRRKSLLIEFPAHSIPPAVRHLLFELRLRGLRPVITHPERNFVLQGSPGILEGFVKAGCLVQVTAGSLTGRFGGPVRRFARELLKRRMVHVIASDCHSVEDRPPLLSDAVDVAAGIVGAEDARAMVDTIPGLLVRGEDFDPPEPEPPRGFWARLSGRA